MVAADQGSQAEMDLLNTTDNAMFKVRQLTHFDAYSWTADKYL